MSNWHWSDFGSAAGFIAGGGCAGVFTFLALIDKPHAEVWLGASGMVIAVAGLVRVVANHKGAPATSIVSDATVVPSTEGPK